MTYITTNHRFIIDEKHPADVFDEMENFFSLYTTAIDDLQQVSVQLSVPSSFDINANKKMAESYRQFIKSLKYTIPDINILPVKSHTVELDDENSTVSEEDNSVVLLIQRLDGYAVDEDDKPSLYQSVLGRLIPRFAEEKTETGFYPERQQIILPEPMRPQIPVQQPMARPSVSNIQPQFQHSQPQPQPTQQYHRPPVQQTNPVIAPIQQAIATPQPIPKPSISQPQDVPQKSSVSVLPNIQKSAKPYQDLLTQAIVEEAKKLVDKSQIISQITLKSNDGLTTAMVQELFNSFNHAHNSDTNQQGQSSHDAIDLVSYGYEVLKPKLSAIGVTLSDEAQFGLKTKAQATSNDIARLHRGEVFSNEIKLGVKLLPLTQPMNNSSINQTTANAVQPQSQAKPKPQYLNQNQQNIVLIIKCVDGMGERQQKVREFPIVFASRDSQIPHALRLFSPSELRLSTGVYFSIVESEGQVLIDDIDANVNISRNGVSVKQYDVLLPNDILSINNMMSVQLLLAN